MIIEKQLTNIEIGEMLKMTPDKAQRLFKDEPGVFVSCGEKKKYKKTRKTIRVPESVFLRVYRRMSNPS